MTYRRARSQAILALFVVCITKIIIAQDDVTTRNGSSAINGGWITGPASNPLSFLNGPAYRTFGSKMPYDFPDFKPIGQADQHLPRRLNLESEERFRVEGYRNGSFNHGNDDFYLLNRFRFQADLTLNRWMSMSAQLQDARPFLEKPPIGPPNENRWDLKEAYAQAGNPETQWISLRVGRQLINYNNTIVANSEWRNQGRSYDAAVANLHHGNYRLGIFAASVVIPQDIGVSPHTEGNNLYGLYGGIDGGNGNYRLEPFFLWRVQPNVSVKNAGSVKTGKQDMKVYGFRYKAKADATLDYAGEAVLQTGSDGPNPISAWAVTGGAGYQFDSNPWHLRVFGQYDFASGDTNPSDTTHRTFDTIYPTAHDRFGILDLFGWQNMDSYRGGATIIPRHRWSVTAQYLDFWLASAKDSAYNGSGATISRDPSGQSGRHIGIEADVYSWYEVNRHLNIGGGYGAFNSGQFMIKTTTTRLSLGPYFAINFKDAGRARDVP